MGLWEEIYNDLKKMNAHKKQKRQKILLCTFMFEESRVSELDMRLCLLWKNI